MKFLKSLLFGAALFAATEAYGDDVQNIRGVETRFDSIAEEYIIEFRVAKGEDPLFVAVRTFLDFVAERGERVKEQRELFFAPASVCLMPKRSPSRTCRFGDRAIPVPLPPHRSKPWPMTRFAKERK